MGARTRASIVSAGLALAGRGDLTTLANGWLEDWLRDQYKAWPWPQLQKRKITVPLVTSSISLDIGAGSGGVTNEIIRIHDPVYIYSVDYRVRDIIRLTALVGADSEMQLDIQDSTVRRGRPAYAKARPFADGLEGKWNLAFDCAADQDYLLALDYVEMPAALTDADRPVFPSDEIMLMVIQAKTLDFMQRFQESMQLWLRIDAKLLTARTYQGESPGLNDSIGLDPNVFG